MMGLSRRLRAAVPNLTIGVLVGLTAGGGAFALAAQTPRTPEDAGVHGGPKPRFHDAGVCDLVDLGPLEAGGNWTHGDYVRAVAKADPSDVRDAAHSRCGKPDHGAAPGARGKSKAAKEKARAEKTKEPKEKPSPEPAEPAVEPSPSPSPSPAESSPEPSPDASSPESSPEAPEPEPTESEEGSTGSPDAGDATP